MLVIAAVYFIVPGLRGADPVRTRGSVWAFWLMTIGLAALVLCMAIAGIVQVYLWRIGGVDFMVVRENYVIFWMALVLFFGATMILPGVLLYLRDLFFDLRSSAETRTIASV